MWTFDNFPIQTVNDLYGTHIDQAWLDRVRGAAVRINGCSASLVSGEGLVLTNHHCVVGCVQDLSTRQHDYVKNGWMPATREEERQCPGQTAEILTDITDVTDRVLAAGAGLEGAAFVQARGAVQHGDPDRGMRRRSQADLPGHQLLSRRPLRPVQVPQISRTCGWCSRRSSRRPSSAATRTISTSPAMRSIPASCVCTRTASRSRRRTT